VDIHGLRESLWDYKNQVEGSSDFYKAHCLVREASTLRTYWAEAMLHEMAHIATLHGVERLKQDWAQSDIGEGLGPLTILGRDQNEVDTSAVVCLIGDIVGCPDITSESSNAVYGNIENMSTDDIDEGMEFAMKSPTIIALANSMLEMLEKRDY
jgi:hypothetical protein